MVDTFDHLTKRAMRINFLRMRDSEKNANSKLFSILSSMFFRFSSCVRGLFPLICFPSDSEKNRQGGRGVLLLTFPVLFSVSLGNFRSITGGKEPRGAVLSAVKD